MKLRGLPSHSGHTDDQLNNDGDDNSRSTINPVSPSAAATAGDSTKTPVPAFRPTGDATANGDGGTASAEFVDISADHPPRSARESGESCAGSQAASVTTSTSNLTSTSTSTSNTLPIHRYGHDLSPLTLGRIADGFRRDHYVFPVDLKGRGEGRAVEARAVMQVQQHTIRVLGFNSTRYSFFFSFPSIEKSRAK